MTDAPSPTADEARTLAREIRELAEEIMPGKDFANEDRYSIADWLCKAANRVEALSRIPSEEARKEEICLALSGLGNYKLKEVNVAELLSRSNLRITRAPGAKT